MKTRYTISHSPELKAYIVRDVQTGQVVFTSGYEDRCHAWIESRGDRELF